MNEFALSLLLLGALSTGGPLPFWMTANQFGLMPNGDGALALAQAGTQYDTSKTLQWKWGVGLAGNVDTRCPVTPGMTEGTVTPGMTEGTGMTGRTADFKLMVDELYGSLRWKALSLDAGMKRVDTDFLGVGMPALGSMSTTGGHVAWSGNARTMPGYLLTVDPVPVPFTHQVFWVSGAFGDYMTLDNRYVQGALVHRTKFAMHFKILPRLEFKLGLDHAALWGGTSPVYGKMPLTFDNYFRVITGRGASVSGTVSDQLNVIGDQRGGIVARFDWRGDGWRAVLQRDTPYDDGSGMAGVQNFPDGVYTLYLGLDRKDRWVTDFLYEYQYSMWQSGTRHDRPTTEEERAKLDPSDQYHYWHHITGGGDNYFNNGGYRSGWTYYGRTIGNPLFLPKGTHAGTWTDTACVLGVENNRLKAHHLSLAGKAFRKYPYKLMLTYSRNYGTYSGPYVGKSQWGEPWGTVEETPLRQLSGALSGVIPFRHLSLTWGLYADRGQLLPDQFGATLGLRYDLHPLH